MKAILLALLVALALPAVAASPLALSTHVAAADRPSVGFDYVAEQAVVDVAGTLTFVNADLRAHDVVSDADGPADNPWCDRFTWRGCPLFASDLVGLGGTALVQGTGALTPLESYGFYCTTHPFMTGTLTAI